ncbi:MULTISPECIES: hypothetical protein [Halobacterium]|uniref:hypothetical protein n=1 Tax=Halobacterium TaxID=2239 RepID=UPI0012FBDA11|nr:MULTISPECIES: hypothetical protein [Halobacterium]MCG1004123.1 hypothetical protein [Halobacterium noricense]
MTAAAATDEDQRQDEREKFEKISKKRRNLSTEEFHTELKEAGFEVYSSSYEYAISDNGETVKEKNEDEISPESFPEGDLTTNVSLFVGGAGSYADLDWTVDTGFWEDGAPPVDNITLAWSDNQYLYDGEANHASDGDISLRTRDAAGAVWQWDDENGVGETDSAEGNVTAYLQSQGDCHTRQIYGTYEHTWGDISVQSISIGSGGVSIVYSDETKRWKVFPSDEFEGTC